MEKGTKVHVKLNAYDAKKLGISKPIDSLGIIEGSYTSDVAGHFIIVDGKTMAIADKYNALTEV